MQTVVKSKRVSYGWVEIRDSGPQSPRYGIYLDGRLREYSDDLNYLISVFNNNYY